MDAGTAIVGALSGGGFVAVVGFVRELWRGRRSAQVQHARVKVAQLDAEQVTLGLLADRVRSLETAQTTERTKCDEQIAEVRAEAAEQRKTDRVEVHKLRNDLDVCKRGHAVQAEQIKALSGEVIRLRSDMRREDDTRPIGPAKEKR